MKLNSITLGLVAALTLSTTIFAQDDNQAKYDKMFTPEEAPLSKAERLKLDEQLKN